jgi:hypothetical protein
MLVEMAARPRRSRASLPGPRPAATWAPAALALLLPLLAAPAACSAGVPSGGEPAETAQAEAPGGAPGVVLGEAAGPFDLAGQPLRLTVPLAPGAGARLEEAIAGEDPRRLGLLFEGVAWERGPGLHYEVYLGLPAGATPDPSGPHFVDNLAFFGAASGERERVEELSLVAPLRRLARLGAWRPDEPLVVTFVPRGPAAGSAPDPEAAAKVSIRRLRVVAHAAP